MRPVTPEDGRKLCCALMLAHKRTRKHLTSASWRVAGMILQLAEASRDTSSVEEISGRLDISQKVARSALKRLQAAEIVGIKRLPGSVMVFEINWPLLDDVTSVHDQDMQEYWRQRDAEDDHDDGG